MKEKKFVYNRESFTFGFINNNLYLNNNYYTYGEILENNQKNCIQILRKRKKKFYKPGDYVGVYPENIYVKNQFLNSIFYVFKLFKQVDLYFLKDLFKKYKSLCFKDINF
ncbi:hypothetical protein E5P55_00165 [Candidatus Pinguicoccus supinus]|uniref:Uncharacterized protein n=1 Tax=Candidatus Pinguicoccus supinus TaxID=2529394 RepID=A0A7T0BRB8_9BACT|nr:hypothetical protein E5P55_00165 [Candidatus Pinguicoccus supinus]